MNKPVRLEISADDSEVGYLYLPDYPKENIGTIVDKQLRLSDLIEGYKGPDIYLDFDEKGVLIGIEIT
jgi:uncharacterized protein YuzE